MNAMTDWRAAYDALRARHDVFSAEAARSDALARFTAHGLPTKRHEYWKYTPVAALSPDAPLSVGGDDPFADVDAWRLTFVDGLLDPARSDRAALAAALELGGPAGEPWMDGLFADLQKAHTKVARPMADLNLAMFTDGLSARVAPGARLEKPIHLRYEGVAPAHLRLALRIGAGAEVTVLESGAGALTTGAEIVLEDGAALHHLRAQTETAGQQFTALFASVGAGASLKSFTLCQDGALLRNDAVVTLAGEGASGHVAAAVLGGAGSHIDNTVYVSHDAPGCESRQVVKAVLGDGATSVFQGKIFVDQIAQKTDGYQISQAVLLSERGQFLSKPEVEIYAEDVKCSHGCTTGALDETAMFYLRSRGVPQGEAEALLVSAFVDEAVMEISDESLQAIARAVVERWMRARP